MDHQPAHYGDCIKAQLFPNGCGVIHLQDFAGDEEHNAEGEVPVWGQDSQLSARQVRVPGSRGAASLPDPPEPARAP